MKKGKLVRFTAMFFAMMLAFTLLSRAADSSGVAVVTTSKPTSRTLSHTITATGKIVQNQELAVTTVADLRVKSIAVSEGDRVSEGDLLFELDEDYLDEQILYQEQEMEIQELTLADMESQQSVSSLQKANEQASASEQYALSTQSASLTLSRAKEALQEAKDALAEYRNSSGTTTSTDSSVETALEEAVEEKTEAYIDAQQELLALQWKIENAVNEALKAAESSASLTGTSTTKTQSAGESANASLTGTSTTKTQSAGESASGGTEDAGILPVSEDTDILSVSEDAVVIEDTESTGDSSSTGSGENTDSSGSTGNSGTGSSADSGNATGSGSTSDGSSTESDDAIIIEDVETVDSSTQTGSSSGTSSSTQTGTSSGTSSSAQSGTASGTSSSTTTDTSSAASGTSASTSLTQAELDAIEEEVRDSYSAKLTAAQKAVDTALAEKEAAESALEEYQAELLALASASDSETESQLTANLKSAQEAYEDAALAANEAQVTAARSVASANIPDASDSSVRQQEIAYEQMELTLNRLQELKEDGGKVYAPADGLITGINITVGEKTSDGTAVKMADTSKGFRFTAELSKEDQQYIGAGDLVTLTGNSGNAVEDLEVDSVTEDNEEEDVYNIVVQVPDDSFELGAAVTLEFTKISGTYSVCVPISALYMDDYNQPYVLVTDEYETVMGTETKVRSVSVSVLESDGTYAALQEGVLSADQQVITGADKAIGDGSRVRTES